MPNNRRFRLAAIAVGITALLLLIIGVTMFFSEMRYWISAAALFASVAYLGHIGARWSREGSSVLLRGYPAFIGTGLMYMIIVLNEALLYWGVFDATVSFFFWLQLITGLVAAAAVGAIAFVVKTGMKQDYEVQYGFTWEFEQRLRQFAYQMQLDGSNICLQLLLKRVESLADAARFSDSRSHSSLETTERLIMEKIEILEDYRMLLKEGKTEHAVDAASRLLVELHNDLEQRNRALAELE